MNDSQEYKAEIQYANKWVKYYIFNNIGLDYRLTKEVIETLPKSLTGRIVTNVEGYNPSGWYTNITIDKENVRFIKETVVKNTVPLENPSY
jgi:hypothetical protein